MLTPAGGSSSKGSNMTVQVGDEILGGQIIVAEVKDGLVTKIRFPFIKDAANNEMVLTYDPGKTVPEILALLFGGI